MMNRKLFLVLFLNCAAFFGLASVATAQQVPSASLLDQQTAEKANAHEEELYTSAKDALDNGEFDNAIKQFDEVIKIHGRRADGATYWKAYALNKAGNKAQALIVIGELRKNYPKSNWLRDAAALEQEIRGGGNPENISDEELKMLALQSLLNTDPEKAIPLLDKIIQGNYSSKLKDKALFVLSQSGSEKAQQILLTLAKSNNQPDLQKRAIRYMGMNGNGRNRAALKEIYNSSTDMGVKKSIFQAWLMCGCKDDVAALARTEKNPELRREAIRYLGMMGGRTELLEFYKNSPDAETREAAVGAMLLCGCAHELAEIVQTEKDPAVLDKAINTLGLVGGDESLAALTKVYNSQADLSVKKKVVNALFLHGAGKEMVALARKETNPELKKSLIQKMSLMSSPEISEYMMEILNK
ncbi:MAG TPA: HEAT repeat domain-containing protein [Candidatus Polarisedimenticolia bacterium]|jgi:HEAT repeat protein|nr:HEAT repeat domain-containing protein [Candidatus Polarisedimenticolia bacterium]